MIYFTDGTYGNFTVYEQRTGKRAGMHYVYRQVGKRIRRVYVRLTGDVWRETYP